MSLDKSILQSHIKNLLTDFPTSKNAAIQRWTNAYHVYAIGAEANGIKPVLSNNFITLELSKQGDFIELFSAGLMAYWTGAIWSDPSFTGVTSFIPPFSIGLKVMKNTLMSQDNSLVSANIIADQLHNLTNLITVALTNNTSGAVIPSKIS